MEEGGEVMFEEVTLIMEQEGSILLEGDPVERRVLVSVILGTYFKWGLKPRLFMIY